MTRRFLDDVYDLGTEMQATERLYSDWAQSYDAEVGEHGYVAPGRCATALAKCTEDQTAPIIDIGCGTGLSGLAFKAAGFSTIDGVDLTPAMIEQARARGLYRDLRLGVAEDAPFAQDAYTLAAAVGLFSPAHAPASTIDAVMNALPRGGRFVFTLNDHALADHSYLARIMAWTDSGAAHCLFREHGAHLPGKNIESTVYVLGKN